MLGIIEAGPKKLHAGAQGTRDGQPTRAYRKDILTTGWVNAPDADWEVEYTTEDLSRFVDRFNAMNQSGIDVEVTVDHSWGARDVLGYVTGMGVEAGWLYADIEIVGQDNIDLVERVRNVSIEVLDDYTDSRGRNYGRVIRAVSFVQSPRIAGQRPAVELAQHGLAGVEVRILRHSTEPQKRGLTMELKELLKLVGTHTGIKDLDEKNAEERLKAFSAGLTTERATAKTAVEKYSAVETERDQWKAKHDAVKAAAPEGVQLYSKMPTERREIVDDAADLVLGDIKALKGKTILVDDDVVKAFSAVLVGPDGERHVQMLSRGKDGAKRPAQAVIETMKSKVQADIRNAAVAQPVGGSDGEKEAQERSVKIAKQFSGAPAA